MDEGLLKPGAVLNSTYKIEALVGEGGTGEVYRAINTASQRTVAIKILKTQFSQDPKFIDLMRRELLHNVSDDAVVRYYDLLRTAEDQGGLYFLVMDFIDGPSVADLMRDGPVSADHLMILARRVAQGLAACHGASIFHRDISPDNIILRDGDPAQATLIDFGIAKDVRPDAKTVVGGGFAGKYEYAAPEQLDGIADSRSDIYSFGMTLLAAARGESPKLGTSFLEIVKAKHAPVDTEGVGEPLRALVDSMVRPSPDDRPQSANELLGMIGGGAAQPSIESLLADEAQSPRPTHADRPNTAVPQTKKKRGGLVAALIALGVIGGGAYFALGPGKETVQGLLAGLPEADPYAMTITSNEGVATVAGNAPSADSVTKIRAALSDRLPLSEDVPADIIAASGAPNDAWQSTVIAMAGELAKLDSGTLEFRDDQISLGGMAESESSQSAIERTARTIARNGKYRIALSLSAPEPEPAAPPTPLPVPSVTPPTLPPEPQITTPSEPSPAAVIDTPIETPPAVEPPDDPPRVVGTVPETETPPETDANTPPEPGDVDVAVLLPDPPPQPPINRLQVDVVQAVLDTNAQCGPLTTESSSGSGFDKDEIIAITGSMPTEESIEELRQSLFGVADGRSVDTRGIEVLNASVCSVMDVMPPANIGPASLLYYSSKTGVVVQEDALKPDDQAIVYFSAPKDMDGYLYVFITDNEFNTIHLFPMQTRTDNQLSEIGTVTGDERRVQLSWPPAEGSRKQPVLAFTEPYGVAKMFAVVLDDTELFTHMRAGVEDTRELVPVLADAIAEARVRNKVLSYVQRFILVDQE